MNSPLIVDTGVWVSYLDARATFHEWSVEQFKKQTSLPLTCEAVVTETLFLMNQVRNGWAKAIELFETGAIKIPFHLEDELKSVTALMRKYHDVPMSLADACLVRMAETYRHSTILTLDGDFKIYRMHGNRVIPARFPPEKA